MRKRVNLARKAVLYVLVVLFMFVTAFALVHTFGGNGAETRISSDAASDRKLTDAEKRQYFTPYFQETTVNVTSVLGAGGQFTIYTVNEGSLSAKYFASASNGAVTATMLGYKTSGGYRFIYGSCGNANWTVCVYSSTDLLTMVNNIHSGSRVTANSSSYQNLYVDSQGYIYMKVYNMLSTSSLSLTQGATAYFKKDGEVVWAKPEAGCLNVLTDTPVTGGGSTTPGGGGSGSGGGSTGFTPESALAMAAIDGNHLTYTGEEHDFTQENTWVRLAKTLNSSIIFAGKTTGTNVGKYTLVALLSGSDYRMIDWYIDKADPQATPQTDLSIKQGESISADSLFTFDPYLDPTKDGGTFTVTVSSLYSDYVTISGSAGALSGWSIVGGAKAGTATVKIAYSGGTNLNAKTWEVKVTNSLSSQIYTKNGDAVTYYTSLKEAVEAVTNGTAEGPVYIEGAVEVDAPIALSGSVTIAQGDNKEMPAELTLTANEGSMFEVGGAETTLTLQNITAKGATGNAASLASVTGGTLALDGVTAEGFNGSAINANGAEAKVTLSGENNFKQCGGSLRTQNGGAIALTGGASLSAAEGAENVSVSFTDCAASEFGGAIYAEGATVDVSKIALDVKNCAAGYSLSGNGGAIYLGKDSVYRGGKLSVTGCTTGGKGGAVYVGAGAKMTLAADTSVENNTAAANANGVYIADGATLNLPTAATVNDGIMLGYEGQDETNAGIVLSGSVPEGDAKIIVEFEDPANQIADFEQYIRSADGLSSDQMKSFMRVKNAGYTFEPNADGTLHLVATNENVAAYLDPTTETWVPCKSLQDAINAAAPLSSSDKPVKVALYQYNNKEKPDSPIQYGGDLDALETIRIPAGANIELGSVTATVSETGGETTYDDSVAPFTLKRGATLADEMIKVDRYATLTLTNVILDGGAVWDETASPNDHEAWTAEAGKVKIADDGKGGAGSVETNNKTGVVAHAPVIVNEGTLNIVDGATIQNNDNNWAAPGKGFGSQNYGGGVRNQGAGTLNMKGGIIKDCYSREGGAIMNVNKPENTNGTANPNYVDPAANGGRGPQVNITGGMITGNVSQMKGAAVQSIYGGAETNVSEKADITGNVSLNDLGVLSVEEGASLTVSGGTMSAVEPYKNALYLYNQYSAEDYKGAETKPYIEGKGAGKLAVNGAPSITGNVFVDGSCYAVDTKAQPSSDGNYPASDTYYETYVDVTGFAGSGLTVDFKKTEDGAALTDGAIAKATGEDAKDVLGKLGVKTEPPTGFADSFFFLYEEGDETVLAQGSYALEVWQTEAGKLTVSGKVDVPNCTKATLTVGGKEYTASVSPEGDEIKLNPDGSFEFTVEMAEPTREASLGLFYGDGKTADATVEGLPLNAVVLAQDGDGYNLELPEGWKYVDEEGNAREWKQAGIPADLAIDGQGCAEFQDENGETKTVKVGSRAAEPDLQGAQFTLVDATDTSLTVGVDEAHSGLEYALMKDGEIVKDEDGKEVWITAEAGKLTFTGLSEDTQYTLYARTPAGGEALFPGLPANCNRAYLTLTADQQTARQALEAAYGEHFDEEGLKDPKVASTTLKGVLDKYSALDKELQPTATEEYQKFLEETRKELILGAEAEKKAATEEAYALRCAEEWLEANEKTLQQTVNYAEGPTCYPDAGTAELSTLKKALKAADKTYKALSSETLSALAGLLWEKGYDGNGGDTPTAPLPTPLEAYLALAKKEMKEKVEDFLQDEDPQLAAEKKEKFGAFCDECVNGIEAAVSMEETDLMLENFGLAVDAVDALQTAYNEFVAGQKKGEPAWENTVSAGLVAEELSKQYLALANRQYSDEDKTEGKLSEAAKSKIAEEAKAAFTLADNIGDAKKAYVAAFNAALTPEAEKTLKFTLDGGKETGLLDLTPYAADEELNVLAYAAQRAVNALDSAKDVGTLNALLQENLESLLDGLLTEEEAAATDGEVFKIVKEAKAAVESAISGAAPALVTAEALSGAVKEVKAEIEARRLKDDAVAQYKAAHKAIKGTDPAEDDETITALTNADMGTADALNTTLKEAVTALVDDAVTDADGSLVRAYADSLKNAIESAEPNVRGVAKVADAVDGAKETIEFLRGKEAVLKAVEEAYTTADKDRVSVEDDNALSAEQAALKEAVEELKLERAATESGVVYESWANALARAQKAFEDNEAAAAALKEDVLRAIAKQEYIQSHTAIAQAPTEAEISVFEASIQDMGTTNELNATLKNAIGALLEDLLAKDNGESKQSKVLQDLVASAQTALGGVELPESEIADFSASFEKFGEEAQAFCEQFKAQQAKELAEAKADYLASYQAVTGNEAQETSPQVKAVMEKLAAAKTTAELNSALYVATADLLDVYVLEAQEVVTKAKEQMYAVYQDADIAATRTVAQLSDTVSSILGNIVVDKLNASREAAVAEYKQQYAKLHGGEPAKDDPVIEAIKKAPSAEEADKALKDGVSGLLEGKLTSDGKGGYKDSNAVQGVIAAAKESVQSVSPAPSNGISDLDAAVEEVLSEFDAQVAADQKAAQDAYLAFYNALNGTVVDPTDEAVKDVLAEIAEAANREDLNAAVQNKIEELLDAFVKADADAVKAVADGFKAQVQGAVEEANTDGNVVPKGTLAPIAEQAKNAIEFARLREQAKAEYEETYKAAKGETDPGLAAAKAEFEGEIQDMGTLDELNEALGEAADGFLDGMKQAGDSQAIQDIIDAAKDKVAEAVKSATAAGNIANVSDIVATAKAEIENQRLKDAKDALAEAYEAAAGNMGLTPDAAQKQAIQDAATKDAAKEAFKEALEALIDEAAEVDEQAPAENSNLAKAVEEAKAQLQDPDKTPAELAEEMKKVKDSLDEAKAHDTALADLTKAKEAAKEAIQAAYDGVPQTDISEDAKTELNNTKTAKDNAVDEVVLNKEEGKTWTEALATAQAELDGIVKAAEAELPAIRYRELAAKEYEETYKAAKGETDPGLAAAKAKFEGAIQDMGTLDELNEALGEAADGFLDGLKQAGDSEAIQAIIDAAKSKVADAVKSATEEENIPDVSKIVEETKPALEDQRLKDAKDALAEAYEAAAGNLGVTPDAAQEQAIQDAATVEDAEGAFKEALEALIDEAAKVDEQAPAENSNLAKAVEEAKQALSDPAKTPAELAEEMKSVKDSLAEAKAHDTALADLTDAKEAAKEAIQAAYDGVPQTDISEDAKTKLTTAKDDALGEVDGVVLNKEEGKTWTEAFEDAQAELDGIVEAAEAELPAIRYRELAAKEYEETYKAAKGEDEGLAAAKAKFEGEIKDMGTLDELNEALGEAADGFLDGLKQAGDSQAIQAIIDAAKGKVTDAVTAATAEGSVPDVSKIVEETKPELAAQRAVDAQKAAKKAEIAEELKKVPAGNQETARKFQEVADAAIDAAQPETLDELTEQLKDRIGEKLEVLKHLEEKKNMGEAAGVPAEELAKLDGIADDAYTAIDEAETAEDARSTVDEAKRDISCSYAESYLKEAVKDDSQSVKDAITGEDGFIGKFDDVKSAEKADKLLEEAEDAIEGERFFEENKALSKPFGEIEKDDTAALAETQRNYDALDDGVKKYLDEKAKENGYSGTKGELLDRAAGAQFEERKAELVEEAKDLLHEHDGEYVKEKHAEKVNEMQDLGYTKHTNDGTRAQHLKEEKARLDDAYAAAKRETEHAQSQQRFANRAAEEAERRGNNGQYNDALKEQLMEVAKEYSERAMEIPATTDYTASKQLEELYDEFLDALDEVPVIAVSTGKVNPDGSFAGEGEAEYDDYDGSLWGAVENQSTMPGGIRLIIEETPDDRKAIASAIKNGKIVAAEGSEGIDEAFVARTDKKDVVATIDIYLLKNNSVKITEFDGMYLVSMLLPQSLRSLNGLELVYVGENGIEVYETKIVEGKYLEFKTAHFSQFVLLAEQEVNLWWLVILLACILALEIVILFYILLRKEESDKTMFFSVAPLGALLTILIPSNAVALCIVLGAVDLAGFIGLIVAVCLKKRDLEKWRKEHPEEASEESED